MLKQVLPWRSLENVKASRKLSMQRQLLIQDLDLDPSLPADASFCDSSHLLRALLQKCGRLVQCRVQGTCSWRR